MYYIIAGAIIFLFAYLFFQNYGQLSFWGLTRKHSELFYSFIQNEEAWVIDDGTIEIDVENYDGPFKLYLDQSGMTIKFYGKVGEYEESQKKFKKIVSNL